MSQSEFIDEFKTESMDNLTLVESILLKFESIPESEKFEAINALFRSFHSIKGVAGFLGFKKIVELTHAYESMLQEAREGQLILTDEHISCLLEAQETLGKMIQFIDLEDSFNVSDLVSKAEKWSIVNQDTILAHMEATATQINIAETQTPIQNNSNSSSSDSIRVRTDLLNQMFQLVGELVLIRNQNLLSVDHRDLKAKDQSQRLNLVTSELQSCVMRTRLQPLNGLFNRLHRVAREVSSQLNKDINIQILGGEVEIDKSLLESLTDPLIHMIRNSCDHGIEFPADRLLKGKNATGLIQISARYESGEVLLEIKDDGAGMDPDFIAHKAVEKGLKTIEEISGLTPNQKFELIFLPGFSTAAQISGISGRGVGMDVVKTSIEKCGGRVEVESKKGTGSLFTLHLPLTLAIMPAILLESMGQKFALSQSNIEELVVLHGQEIMDRMEIAENQLWLHSRKRLLPVIHLNDLLHCTSMDSIHRQNLAQKYWNERQQISTDLLTQEHNHSKSLMIIKVGTQRFALEIDSIIGSEEIVVKSLHKFLSEIQIYTGSTVLGDGSIALILDSNGILDFAQVDFHRSQEDNQSHQEATKTTQCLKFKLAGGEKLAIPTPVISRIVQLSAEHCFEIAGYPCVDLNGVTHRILDLGQYLPISPCAQLDGAYLILPQLSQSPYGIFAQSLEDIADLEINPQRDLIHSPLIDMTCLDDGHPILLLNMDEIEKASLAQEIKL